MRAVCIGAAVLPQRRVRCGICREIAGRAPEPTCRRSFCTALTAVRLLETSTLLGLFALGCVSCSHSCCHATASSSFAVRASRMHWSGSMGSAVAGSVLRFRFVPLRMGAPTSIRIGCLTPAFSGPKRGQKCYITHAVSGVPKQNGTKSDLACLTPALQGAKMRAEMLRHPCILGVPKQRETKSEVAASTPYLLGAQKRAEMLRHPCILGGPQTKRDKIGFGYRTPALPGGPERGRKCYVAHAFSGVPRQKGTKSELVA